MPRKKKDPNEMTDEEMMTRVFSKTVVKAVRQEIKADEPDEPTDSLPTTEQST